MIALADGAERGDQTQLDVAVRVCIRAQLAYELARPLCRAAKVA
jgi:hypothetical protein